MKKILVSGLINLEVTLQIDSFPIPYFPVRYPFHGINSTVSGVGYNVATALTCLGSRVDFLSLTGNDDAGDRALEALKKREVGLNYIIRALEKTPHSVILYDREGKRQIHVDLKNIQEEPYPRDLSGKAMKECSLAALCNINFSRPMLSMARQKDIPIATDIHAISSLDDDYNRDFMEAAHILFMSDELLPCPAAEWVERLLGRYSPHIIVVGLGKRGALLYDRQSNRLEEFPAFATRPVKNTIGAGDALFSAFLHFYGVTGSAAGALEWAQLFASYKIGAAGAAEGFLTEQELRELRKNNSR